MSASSQISACREALEVSLRSLDTQWSSTVETWRDAKAIEFFETFVAPIQVEIDAADAMLRHLADAIDAAARDLD